MMRELVRARSMQIAVVALVASLGLAAWTAARAIRLDAVTAAPPPRFATEEALARAPVAELPDIDVVVGQNLFSPDRTAPPRRYRLTGYAEAAEPAEPPARPIVLGTAVADGNRSFAVCRLPDGPSLIVRVGERLGIYTVKSIERNVVVFVTPSGEQLAITASRQ
jgi:hypothetical protein